MIDEVTSIESDRSAPLASQSVSAAAQQAQQRYQALVESLDGIVWEADSQTFQFTFVSSKAEQLLGYSIEQWLNEPDFWRTHMHPDDRSWAVSYCAQAVQMQQNHELEYRMVAADGRVVWLRDTVIVAAAPNQPPILQGVMLDITAQRHAEAERDQFFRLSLDMLALVGFDGYFKRLNPAWQTTLGFSLEALLSRPLMDLIHPDDRRPTQLHLEQLKTQTNSISFENRCQCLDGSNRWLLWNVTVAEGEQRFYAVVHDITERKQTEKALQRSHRRMVNILGSITDAFLTLDHQWRFTYLNPQAEQLLQRRRDTLIGQCIWEQFPAAIGSLFYQEYHRAVAERTSVKFEAFYAPLNVWLTAHAYPFQEGLAVYLDNISEQKRVQAELHRQVERERLMSLIAQRVRQSLALDDVLNTTVAEVRQFLEVDRVIIYRFFPNWSGVVVVESVADQWVSLLRTEIYDCCFPETYINLYCQGRIKAMADVQTAGLTPCHLEMLNSVQVRASLVVPILQPPSKDQASRSASADRQDQLWGLLIAHHCAEPRHWNPLEIDLLQQLATQVAIAIQQSELYQQVQQLNATLEQQVQERTAQLQQLRSFDALLKRITDKVRDSLDESQILQTAVHELGKGLGTLSCDTALYDLEQGTSTVCCEYTTTNTHTQGKTYCIADYFHIYGQLLNHQCTQCSDAHEARGVVTVLACPILDDQGIIGDLWLSRPRGTVFSDREVQLVQQVATQCAIALRQARLYEAAQTQVRELEKLNQLKDDFLSTVSHELRTPVSNMRMSIQMLLLALGSSLSVTPKVDRYLQILKSECEREIQLINDLLDFQRLDQDETQVHSTAAIDLSSWLPKLVMPLQMRAHNRQQALDLVLAPALPLIQTDPLRLERILVELLNNACKYTPPEHHIQLSVLVSADTLQFQVSNTGVEIPQPELPRIFEKFYRVRSSDPWRQGGTGLGLALVQKLSQRLGGTLEVESGNGKTCFTLNLPIDCLSATPASIAATVSQSLSPPP